MRRLLLALVASGIAFAQTEPKSTGTIEGQVTSITGEPLRKVTVGLQQRGGTTDRPGFPANASTGSDGKFVVDDVAPGSYMLIAWRTGFLPQVYGSRLPGVNAGKLIDVQAGSRLTAINLTLTPQAIVSGRVLDEDGDPLQVADIAVYRIGWPNGEKQLVRAGRGVVNPDASFMAGDLAPGRYYLAATVPIPPGAREGYLQTFYPSTTDIGSAIPIDVGAGEQIHDLSIRMLKGARFHVKGRAAGPPVGPGANVILRLTPKELRTSDQLQGSFANVGPDGAFVFENIAPGSYVIESGLSTAIARVPITITNHDLDDVAVPIGPGVTISGSVQADDGLTPVKSLVLQSVENPMSVIDVPAGKDGAFVRPELRPERYRFSLAGLAPDVYVKSAQLGSTPITGDELDLTGNTDVSFRITLAGHVASAGGIVRNEKGDLLVNALVAVWPAAGAGITRVMQTGDDGRFQFASLAPGDYLIAAWEELEAGLPLNRDFRARFEEPAVKVTLDESAYRELEVTAISKAVTQVAVAAFY